MQYFSATFKHPCLTVLQGGGLPLVSAQSQIASATACESGLVVTGINSKARLANCRGWSGESPGKGDNVSAPQGPYQ